MSRKKPVAAARSEADWGFSLVGNEAENLRDAINHQLDADDLDREMALAALRCIDSARQRWIAGNDWLALAELGVANRAFGIAQYRGSPDARREVLAAISAAGGNAKRERDSDGKQAAKSGALELWKERNAGGHPKLRTVEQFATEVMQRWPVLTSSNVIRRWSAEWSKTVREGRDPTL